MKKLKGFKILFNYLKEDKIKLILYILLVLFTYLPGLLSAYVWGKALEYLVLGDTNNFIIYLSSLAIVYTVFWSLLPVPRDLIYNSLELNFITKASKELYTKVDKLPARAFEEMGVGEFINRLYTDPDRVMELLSKLIKLICKSAVVILLLVISFKVSYVLGIEILVFGLIMGFISSRFFPKIKKSQELIKKESDMYVKEATENITGIREIKSLGIRENIEQNIFNRIDSLFFQSRKIKKYEVVYYALNNLTYFILQFVILLTCGLLLIKGNIALSVFMMIESFIWRIDEVVESISDFGVSYNKVTVSLNRIEEIVNNKLYPDELFGNMTLTNTKGVIEFRNTSFKYREDEELTLKNLNLKIEPNKKIAIVGRSGNGKSTIFNLLLRYFDPTEGNILIDGIEIGNLTEKSLRDNISIIRQTPFLFNLSIFDNLKLVKENVTLEEIREVCKKAYIDDYIMSLPNKYDTIIGEGGINLSGGQKQRLAIARTILINTKIILFDEATSALDNESQEYIKKTIDELVKDHTVVIVAHRLSTIIDADVINIIDKGTLLDSGTHKELLTKCDVYKNLYLTEDSNSDLA